MGRTFQYTKNRWASPTQIRSTESDVTRNEQSNEEKIGNLLADDEWEGLGMELSELVRVAVIEDLKKKSRDFLGKDEYKGKWTLVTSFAWI